MEAQNSSFRLNVGINFQVKVIDSTHRPLPKQFSSLQAGEIVQIYPHTVNPRSFHDKPVEVAARKIKDGSAYGHFFTLPVRNLELSEEQKEVLRACNRQEDRASYLTRIKGGLCTELIKSVIGLPADCRVQYYPYTMDLFLEKEGSSLSLSPITIAVRKVQHGIPYGGFYVVCIYDLRLNDAQMKEIREIILTSINDFLKNHNLEEKDVKYMMENFSKKLNFLKEDFVYYYHEEELSA